MPPRDPVRRFIASHPPQAEYLIRYPEDDFIEIGMSLVLAVLYHRPVYVVTHHATVLPEKLHALAAAVETYGHHGDDEAHALERILRRIESDHKES